MDRETGFTIIELLIVIVVIGILLTIGVVSLSGTMANARDSERSDDVAAIARKLEQDYNEQEPGGPQYPAMNSFVADAATQTGSAAGSDPNIFAAPGSTTSSVMAATTTAAQTPNGAGSPALNQYFYQALTSNNYLCKDSSQVCVKFRLFYREEANNQVVIISSLHQQ